MALPELLDHFSRAEYRPHSLRLTGATVLPIHLLSDHSARLIADMLRETGAYELTGQADRIPITAFTPAVSWSHCPTTLQRFNQLGADEQAEVLGFITFPIHEITHHIDHLMTPFGVTYHASCCAEYVALQRLIPELTRSSDSFPTTPLASVRRQPEFTSDREWTNTEHWLRFFDACRGAPSWAVDDSAGVPLHLLGTSLAYCRVYNALESAHWAEVPRHYVRPPTLLETRAVIHSLMYIIFLFDKTEAARVAIQTYLRTFYPPEQTAPDYQLLFELLSRMFRGQVNSFTEFVAQAPIINIDSWLRVVDALCWYALQDPPRLDRDDPPTTGPIARLLLGIRNLEARWARDPATLRVSSAVALLNQLDADPHLERALCINAEMCLQRSLEQLAKIRERALINIADRDIRAHFRYIFRAQTHLIRSRVTHGYNSRIGLPENGNVVQALTTAREVDYLALGLARFGYDPKPSVIDWFADRERLLFRYRLGTENEALRLRLSTRFPALVPSTPVLCPCGATLAGTVPPGIKHYHAHCPQCGTLTSVRPHGPT